MQHISMKPPFLKKVYSSVFKANWLFMALYTLNYANPYLLTYLFTPWSRVLHEKLTGSQLVKNFPKFYGTQSFTTALTRAHDLSLSRAIIPTLQY
jgi:hypothetical protein